MGKIKEKLLEDQAFSDKETEAISQYQYTDEGKKHLHTLNDKPLIGTSSVCSVLNKPLHWWALQIGLSKLGWTKIKEKKGGKYIFNKKEDRIARATEFVDLIGKLTGGDYLKLLDEAYYAHDKVKSESAKTGTELHAEIEIYIKSCMLTNNGKPLTSSNEKIKPFVDWALQNVQYFIWSEMHCYSEKYWLGGISDCGFMDNEGKIAILDIKSSSEAYDSQFWQCAGYAIQIEENGGFNSKGIQAMKPIKIDYFVIFPFGMEKPEAQYNYDKQGCVEAFLSALTIYKKINV